MAIPLFDCLFLDVFDDDGGEREVGQRQSLSSLSAVPVYLCVSERASE